MDLLSCCLLIVGICFSGVKSAIAANQTNGADSDSGTHNCVLNMPEGLCPEHAVCYRGPEGPRCKCKHGYRSHSRNDTFTDPMEICEDINECMEPGPLDCGPFAECKNTQGSYYCKCLSGYRSTFGEEIFWNKTLTSCEDVDECLNSSACPRNAHCRNTPGNYSCECKAGYQLASGNSGGAQCTDINECTTVHCGPNAECKNTNGSYYCSCREGYRTKSGKQQFKNKTEATCEDVNECSRNGPAACGPNAKCFNIQGGFSCFCEEGFQPRSRIGNRQSTNELRCEDIDECDQPGPLVCGTSASCINTPGSFICTCWNGFHTPFGKQTFKGPVTNETWCQAAKCKHNKVCGKYRKCTNTSYSCTCEDGYISSEMLPKQISQTPTCLRVHCRSSNDSKQKSCNKTSFLCSLERSISSSKPLCSSLGSQLKQGPNLLKDILHKVDQQLSEVKWNTNQPREKHELASEFLKLMEETAQGFMWLLEDGTTHIGDSSRISIWKGNNSLKGPISLNQGEAQMDLDWETAAGPNNNEVAVMGLLTFKDMATVLSNASLKDWNGSVGTEKTTELKVISKVVTAFISSEDTANLRSPVNFTFFHQNIGKEDTMCVYWNYSENHWSTDGCCKVKGTANETVCTCRHLSSFAVLMAHYPVKSWQLEVITKVGLVISLLCLLISIITFMFCRILKGTRNTIHLHLCISLFLAYTIFLLGISSTDNQTGCSVVAGLLHYFFLASFCWMCLEGVELYLMVVQVFKTHTLKKRYMFLAGYGIPALIVAISAATNRGGYGTKEYCWLSLKGGFFWSFLAPVCLILLINAAIFVITVWKLAQKFSTINPDIGKLKKIRTFTITAIAQLCILGLTWIFGILQLSEHTLVFSYIFTILNSFQGLFIFLLHCLLKKQVREEYQRWLCAAIRLKKPDKYSTFTSSAAPSSSASQSRGLQSSKESGM